MKKLLLFFSVLFAVPAFSQTVTELKAILAASQQDLSITGALAQSSFGNNILLSSAGTGSIDLLTVGAVSYRSFYVQVLGGASISSGQIIFEGSNDNSTFNPIPYYDDAVTTGIPSNTAITIAASTNRFFSGKTLYRYFRCRISTAFVGGTIQALTRLSIADYSPGQWLLSSIATNTGRIPAQGSAAVTGSTPVVLANDLTLTGNAAQTAGNNLLAADNTGAGTGTVTDAGTYHSIAIQINSTATAGTIVFEQSNDGTNFLSLFVYDLASITANPISSYTPVAANRIFSAPLLARYVRVRVSVTLTGGSVQAFGVLSQLPYTNTTQNIQQATAGNLNATIAALPTGANTIGNVNRTAATAAFATITDGTNNAAVKAASTVAATTDPSLVVQLSPNSGATPVTPAGVTVQSSTTQTISGQTATITNTNASGGIFFFNITASSGSSQTIQFKLQALDPVSGNWFDILNATSPSLTTIQQASVTVYPGIVGIGNSTVPTTLPRSYRVAWTIGGTTPSFTFSVGLQPLL